MADNGVGGKRGVRSFVRRNSRITKAQRQALQEHWAAYALAAGRDLLDLDRVFGRSRPKVLEIGAGDGAATIAMVERRGDRDFLAVEVYQPGLGQLLLHAARRGVRNLRVCGDDVMDLLPRLGYEQFDEVFISFPDPWPKKRHHKRRLLQAPFFAQLRGKLQRHGRVFIATDSEDYAVTIGETIDGMPDWQNLAHRAMFAPRPRFRQITKFERRAMVADRKVYEFVLARKD